MPSPRTIRYMGAVIRLERGYYRAYLSLPRGQGRLRKTCRNLDKLKAWVAGEAGDLLRGLEPLSPQQTSDYRAALSALPPGMTLLDAVHAAAAARPAPLANRPASEAIAAYLHTAEVTGRRQTTLRTMRRNLKLLEKHSAAPLGAMGHDQAIACLPPRLAPQTREGIRRGLDSFFRWAILAGYASASPFAAIPRIRLDSTMPAIHTPEQVAELFKKAQTVDDLGYKRGVHIVHDHRILIPYLALSFFGGIRPGALNGLEAGAIDRPNARILISPRLDKPRMSYYAPISDTLAAWLDAYPPGPRIATLSPWRMAIHLRQLYAAAGVERIQDGPRHCYASYTYALTGDAARTAANMGHLGGKTEVLFSHYRSLATPESAAAFFAIRPKSARKRPR